MYSSDSSIGNKKILSLAGNSQTCVSQHIYNLTPGNYNLTYQYVPDKSINNDSNKFGVYLDDITIDSITPTNYDINTRTIEIVRSILNSSSKLTLCG